MTDLVDRPVPPWEVRRGDALALLTDVPDGSVALVATDPPYSSGGMMRGDRAQQSTITKYVSTDVLEVRGDDFTGDNRDQRGWAYWSALWLAEARRATRVGGLLVMFVDWRQLPAATDAVQAGGWVWRGIIPWVKGMAASRPSPGGFWNQCEFVLWATNGVRPAEADRYLPGVVYGNAPRLRDRVHITQKPVHVLELLLAACPDGGLVLDPFAGSGTTGVAAVRRRLPFLGFEGVAAIADVASARIAAAEATTVRDDVPDEVTELLDALPEPDLVATVD